MAPADPPDQGGTTRPTGRHHKHHERAGRAPQALGDALDRRRPLTASGACGPLPPRPSRAPRSAGARAERGGHLPVHRSLTHRRERAATQGTDERPEAHGSCEVLWKRSSATVEGPRLQSKYLVLPKFGALEQSRHFSFGYSGRHPGVFSTGWPSIATGFILGCVPGGCQLSGLLYARRRVMVAPPIQTGGSQAMLQPPAASA